MSEKNNYEKPPTARRVDEIFQEAMNECDIDNPFHAHHIGLMD